MTSAREKTNGSGLPSVPSIPLTAESPARIAEETSIGGLVRDATAHLSTLVRAEVELAKSEIAGEVKKGLKGSVFFVLALTVLAFSMFFLFMALGFGLHGMFDWPLGWSFLTVFGLMILTAAGLGFLGYRKVRKLRAPQKTIASARDTVAALRHRGDGS